MIADFFDAIGEDRGVCDDFFVVDRRCRPFSKILSRKSKFCEKIAEKWSKIAKNGQKTRFLPFFYVIFDDFLEVGSKARR